MPRTAPTTPVLLCFNCGFARCGVKEITAQLAAEKFGNTARDVNTVKRAERFQALFRQASFGITTSTTSIRPPFDVHCQAVLDAFKTGWTSISGKGSQKRRKLTIHCNNAQLALFSMQTCTRLFLGPPLSLILGQCITLINIQEDGKGSDENSATTCEHLS